MVRHQPEGLEQLQAQTKFTKMELQSLYRGFKNVSDPHPSGEAITHLTLLLLPPGRGVLAQTDLLETFMEQQISWGFDEAHVLWETRLGSMWTKPLSQCSEDPGLLSACLCAGTREECTEGPDWPKGTSHPPYPPHTYLPLLPRPQPPGSPGGSVEPSSALDSRHPSEGGVRVRGWGGRGC